MSKDDLESRLAEKIARVAELKGPEDARVKKRIFQQIGIFST
jgi:hypothetical protein